MVRKVFRLSLASTAAFLMGAVLITGMSPAFGQDYGTAPGYGGNYYSSPDGGASAGLYPSPMYAPPVAGYTYIPYGALAPQEMLWVHSQNYVTYQPTQTGLGKTYTCVSYSHNGGWTSIHRFLVGHNSPNNIGNGLFGHQGLSSRILTRGPN